MAKIRVATGETQSLAAELIKKKAELRRVNVKIPENEEHEIFSKPQFGDVTAGK